MAVRWHTTADGFQFDGLPQGALPTRWIGEGVALSGAGAAALRLGHEPLIGRQHAVLSLSLIHIGRRLREALCTIR